MRRAVRGRKMSCAIHSRQQAQYGITLKSANTLRGIAFGICVGLLKHELVFCSILASQIDQCRVPLRPPIGYSLFS